MVPAKDSKQKPGTPFQPRGFYLLLLILALPALEWLVPIAFASGGISFTSTSAWLSLAVADLAGLLLLWPMREAIRSLRFSLSWRDLIGLPAALVAGWMVIPTVQAVSSSLPRFNVSPFRAISLAPDQPSAWVALILGALLAAVTQELLYRGLVWGEARRLSIAPWVAIVSSAALFALLYLPSGLSTFLSVGLAWGVVASVYYGWSRSITGVVLLNILNLVLTYGILFRFL
jgi:membrane protease YdiL (CAAX protease family)